MLVSLPTEAILAIMAGLTLLVIGALHMELELPLPLTLGITVPAVGAGAGIAKLMAMLTQFLFPDAVVVLCIALFLMAGGYEVVDGSPG